MKISINKKPRPLAIFDMAFRDYASKDDRFPRAVTGAGMALAGVLHRDKVATPFFMRKPLVQGTMGQFLFRETDLDLAGFRKDCLELALAGRANPILGLLPPNKDWRAVTIKQLARVFNRFITQQTQANNGTIIENKQRLAEIFPATLINILLTFPEDIRTSARPRIFLISLYDHLFKETQQEVRLIKKMFPEAKIILGGTSVNTSRDLPGLASFFPEVIALVKGDGEKVISGLIEAISGEEIDQAAIKKMQGVYVRYRDFCHCDETLNILSPQEYNLQPSLTAYPALVEDIKRSGWLALNTSRGCKYSCVFCSHNYYPQRQERDADWLIDQLKRIKDLVGKGILPPQARRIDFDDDDFFQDPARAEEFIRRVAEDISLRKFFSFQFQGNVGSFFKKKQLNTVLLDLLQKIRVLNINLGTDCFHPAGLKFLHKGGFNWPMAQELTQALSKRRLAHVHYLILPNPEMSSKSWAELMVNVVKLLNSSHRAFINVLFQLIAVEGNGLMPLLLSLAQQPRFVEAPHGYVLRSQFGNNEEGIEKVWGALSQAGYIKTAAWDQRIGLIQPEYVQQRSSFKLAGQLTGPEKKLILGVLDLAVASAFKLRSVVSETGARKYLPIGLPIIDPEVEKQYLEVLYSPFSAKQEIRQLKKNARSYFDKLMIRELKHFRSQGRKEKLYHLIDRPNPVLQFMGFAAIANILAPYSAAD